MLKLTGSRNERPAQDVSAVSKYLQKVSSLTAPQTEMDMMDINLAAQSVENDALVGLLRKRLEEKKKYELVLAQGLRSAQASEEVLLSQLSNIRQASEQVLKEIKDSQRNIGSMKQEYEDRGKKDVRMKKEINRLELQIKDLQMTLEQTADKEKLAEINSTEADRKVHELEKELIDVRIKNTRLSETNEREEQNILEAEDSTQQMRDGQTRGENASKVKVISLRKTFEERADDIVRVGAEISEAQASLARMRETMRTEAALEGHAIKELQGRLGEEEVANKELCRTLGNKAKIEMQLRADLKTAEAARKMLSAQLDEKMKLSLELSNRLNQLQEHTNVLEERLGDKNIEQESLSKNLEMVKSDVKVLQLQLTKEEHNMLEAGRTLKRVQEGVKTASRSINDKVDSDQTMTLRVKQIEADAALLKDDLDAKLEAEEKNKTRLMKVRERSMMVSQQLEDLELSQQETQERYDKKMAEHDRVSVHLKEKSKQLMLEEHRAKLKLGELQNTLRARTDSVVQLKNGLMLNEVRIRDLTEMLENASVSAEKNRQILSKRMSEISQANKLLDDEIGQEKARGAMFEQDLVNVEGRLRSSLAQLKAQESTAEGMAAVNSQDQEMVMKRLQEQTGKTEVLNQQRASVLSDSRSWRTKLEDELVDKNRALKNLKEQKAVTNKLRDQLEAELDRELEQKSRMKMLEKHNKGVDADLEIKTELCAKTRMELDDYTGQNDILSQELREQELKNEELFGVQNANVAKIDELKNALKSQEQNHLADARAVKMSIVTLQDALMEKISTVEQLVRQTQTVKAKSAELQTRLSGTEQSAAESKQRYEDMLQEEQRLSASLRGVKENKLRDQALLEESIQRKVERINSLDSTLKESINKGEILKSDVSTKRKESEMMTNQLEKKELIEKQMTASIISREDAISLLRQNARDRVKKTTSLGKSVKQAQFENKLLKKQLQEKMKAERYLLAELEGLRLHVPENSNPGSARSVQAQIKANRDFNSVLTMSIK